MIFVISKKIIFIFLILITSNLYAEENISNRIEVLVDERIITKYDVIQRLKIHSILKRVEINDNNYQTIANSVVDDLIVEKLKNKKIEEYKITFEKSEYDNFEKRFYSNADYNKKDLKELFSINNINYSYLTEILEIDLKWQKLIYGLYLRVSSVTEQEINDLKKRNPSISKEIASEIILQKQLDLKSAKLIKDLKDEATIEYR